MYGLIKVLEKVESFGIGCLTTDEHSLIKKYLRETEAPSSIRCVAQIKEY